jgi:hypothetical protein
MNIKYIDRIHYSYSKLFCSEAHLKEFFFNDNIITYSLYLVDKAGKSMQGSFSIIAFSDGAGHWYSRLEECPNKNLIPYSYKFRNASNFEEIYVVHKNYLQNWCILGIEE